MLNQDFELPFCENCKNNSGCCVKSASSTTRKQYTRGEYIAYKGNKVKELPLLTRGKIKTEIVSSSGLTVQIAYRSAPFPIAVTLLFARNNVFPVDIIAADDCEVIYIPKLIIEQAMRECNEFLRGFLEFNAEALQFISERMSVFAQKGIKSKLSYYIISKEILGHYKFDRSIISLAEYFGVERPSLSRAIAEMVRDGLITYNNGEGDILDNNSLQELIR